MTPLPEPLAKRPAFSGQNSSKLRHGDDQEWTKLYSVLRRPLFETIQRVLHNPSASEEVLQEVFLNLFVSRRQWDREQASVLPWALVMARRRAIEYLRAEQNRMTRFGLELAALDRQISAQNPRTRYSNHEDLRLLLEKNRHVDGNQRMLLILAYEQGLSQSEIADHLQLPLGTVKTRVRNALQKLRKVLESPAQAHL